MCFKSKEKLPYNDNSDGDVLNASSQINNQHVPALFPKCVVIIYFVPDIYIRYQPYKPAAL